jgi:hypothetical protein
MNVLSQWISALPIPSHRRSNAARLFCPAFFAAAIPCVAVPLRGSRPVL